MYIVDLWHHKYKEILTRVTMASYQWFCFTPKRCPSVLPLLLSLYQLSHRGFVLKQVCSPAVDFPSEWVLQWVITEQTLSSPALALPHALGKQRLTDYKGEERMGRAPVLYCIHKKPNKKVWVNHSLNKLLYHCLFERKSNWTYNLIWRKTELKITS